MTSTLASIPKEDLKVVSETYIVEHRSALLQVEVTSKHIKWVFFHIIFSEVIRSVLEINGHTLYNMSLKQSQIQYLNFLSHSQSQS